MKKLFAALLGLTALATFFFGRKKSHRISGSAEELQLLYGEAPSGFTIRPEA